MSADRPSDVPTRRKVGHDEAINPIEFELDRRERYARKSQIAAGRDLGSGRHERQLERGTETGVEVGAGKDDNPLTSGCLFRVEIEARLYSRENSARDAESRQAPTSKREK
jgi:hypothetical protein